MTCSVLDYIFIRTILHVGLSHVIAVEYHKLLLLSCCDLGMVPSWLRVRRFLTQAPLPHLCIQTSRCSRNPPRHLPYEQDLQCCLKAVYHLFLLAATVHRLRYQGTIATVRRARIHRPAILIDSGTGSMFCSFATSHPPTSSRKMAV